MRIFLILALVTLSIGVQAKNKQKNNEIDPFAAELINAKLKLNK